MKKNNKKSDPNIMATGLMSKIQNKNFNLYIRHI